ncbi:sensor histidine kinase [Nocardioides pyridinolyticus]
MARRHWHSIRLAAATRILALLALLPLALWTQDRAATAALLLIGAVWALGEGADLQGLPSWTVTVVEPLAVGVVCGVTLHTSTAVLGALLVGPFTAGLRRALPGAVRAFSVGLGATLVTAWLTGGFLSGAEARVIVSISVAGLGLGCIATFLRSALRRTPDPLAPYHDAQALIRQLIDVSDDLTSGLDPAALGVGLLDAVRDELPVTALTLYVPGGRDITPLVGPGPSYEQAHASWLTREPVVSDSRFAFPLLWGDMVVGVVSGRLSDRIDAGSIDLHRRVRELTERLRPEIVRLDTALLFATLRHRASTVERRRLAREMHDGLAQDIASIGYLVDALAATPTTPAQAAKVEAVRRRISTVVAEVRRSVVTLRTGVGEAPSLGAALADVARSLTETSGVLVNVALEERETRLRPEVESELFRIAQQAMTNAACHADAGTIDVHCRVRPPHAVITVSDDGCGLRPARPDSQGLDIMRERAALIGARLDIEPRRPHGTTVTVGLDPLPAAQAPPSPETATA